MTTITDIQTSDSLSRIFATVDGRAVELTRFRGGRVELYEIVDGLASFIGYVDAIAHFLPSGFLRSLNEALDALDGAHRDFWSDKLPGADRWLAA